MKKIFFSFLLSLSFVIFTLPIASFALCNLDSENAAGFLIGCANEKGTIGIDPSRDGADSNGIRVRVVKVATGAISLGALLAVGAIVWSGIQYTKSFGDDEKLKKAKSTGIFALIGLVLLMGSFGLVDLFINFIYTVSGQ